MSMSESCCPPRWATGEPSRKIVDCQTQRTLLTLNYVLKNLWPIMLPAKFIHIILSGGVTQLWELVGELASGLAMPRHAADLHV